MNGATGTATGKTNVVPDKVIVKGDLRFISEAQKEAARAKMREIVAKNLPKTQAKITFEDGIPAMTPNDATVASVVTRLPYCFHHALSSAICSCSSRS